jgi:subtilase family serine protease
LRLLAAAAGAAQPAGPYTTAQCQQQFKLTCYLPDQIQQAYGLPSLYSQGITGKGATIVIIDPYGSAMLNAGLVTFDSATSLPAGVVSLTSR